MRFSKVLRASASAVVLSSLAAGVAYAQDQGESATVDAIIVTATKREQSLQDVPVVVTAVSGQLMQDAGVKDIKDLTILTPGLTVTSTSNETVTTARIRGVGTVGDNPGLESSVGVVIDGVYRPRNGVSFGDLGELERVEVLKGPQGTLFGKNTSAGVINIITKEPEFTFGGSAELTAGNYGAIGGSVSVTGPIVEDKMAGRLFFAKRQRDGYLDVVTGPGPRTQNDDVNQDFWTLRGQLLITPTDDITLKVIGDYTKRDESCCLGTQLYVGQAAASRANMINAVRPGSIDTTNTPFDRKAYANRNTTQAIEDKGLSVEANWDITPDVTMTSVTALRQWRAETAQDSDFTAADIAYRPDDGSNFVEFKQFSQEIRFAGTTERLDWLVGAFYANEELNSRSVLKYGSDYYAYFDGRVLGGAPMILGLAPGTIHQAGSGSDDRYAQKDKTFALFTDNTWAFTDALKLTVGLRYTNSDKELVTKYNTTGASCRQGELGLGTLVTYFVNAGMAPAAAQAQAIKVVGGLCLNSQNADFDNINGGNPFKQSTSEEEVTGTVKLSYKINDDIMTYASYARGYKGGGFNLDRSSIACPPGGRPTKTAAGVACTNGTPLLDFQANPNTSFAPEFADSYELGIKTKWFNNSLLLNGTIFYQEYTDFQLNTFVGTAFIVETIPEVTSKGVDADFVWFTPVQGLSMQGGVTYAKTEYGKFTALDLQDPSRFASLYRLPGAQMSFAPEWSGSVAATYERDIGDSLLFRGNVSAKYTSKYNTGSDLHPAKEQGAFTLVNARVSIGAQDDRWAVELWSNNLFDEDYLQVGFNGPFQVDEANDSVSVYNAFLGAPRTYGVTLRSKF
ncbi:TonB-dependent receptor [Caulobacter mirabilis]|uniref:TonB-dependent receptor n=1 Tax=Caulobacter mirabilis TaxID=69666 RepID=A0A2D2B1F0_9CAUL|nr:TonB-dependent receptor [Caulobacter mirabilis]ATQ44068.1 TonB-dependent receptor [Caulobacter mirabilis]